MNIDDGQFVYGDDLTNYKRIYVDRDVRVRSHTFNVTSTTNNSREFHVNIMILESNSWIYRLVYAPMMIHITVEDRSDFENHVRLDPHMFPHINNVTKSDLALPPLPKGQPLIHAHAEVVRAFLEINKK